MRRVSRRDFIKGGAGAAGAAVAAGVLSQRVSAASTPPGRDVYIHAHGVLTGIPGTPVAGATLAVSIDVAGLPDNLAGAGWDSGTSLTGGMVPGPGPTPTSGPVGACYYTAAGQVVGDEVQLQGRSLFTNRPLATADVEDAGRSDTRADGRLAQINANFKTGVIQWSLGTLPGTFFFEGQGVVIELHS